MGLRWLLSMAGLVAVCTGQATAATGTLCDREQRQLEHWEQQTQVMDRQVERLQQLLDGEPIAPDTLDQALGATADAARPPPAGNITPPALSCESLDKRLNQAVTERRSVRALLDDQRDQWFSLSRSERAALRALLVQYQALEQDNGDIPAVPGALRDHLGALFAVLPQLRNQPANAARELDALWPGPPMPAAIADLPPAQRLGLWRHDYETRRLHLSLRSALWQRLGVIRQLRQYPPAALPSLLNLEARMTFDRLHQGVLQTHREWTLNREIRRYTPLIGNVLAVVLGLAGLALVMKAGRRGRKAILALHERLISRAGQKRWLWNASRLLSGIAPLVPWLLLWLVLGLVEPLLDTPSTQVLRWLLPLARLYVIFGLLWLFGEWLVFRVCQSAHSYLNESQIAAASTLARHQALWMMPPWALWFVVDRLLGHSQLGLLSAILVALALYAAIGRILASRRDDYLLCLQSTLPSSLDPTAERLLRGARLRWSGPLLLPVALVGFLLHYLDLLLGELDWYLRLKARWFRLRTKGAGDDEVSKEDNSQAGREYQKWFAAQLPEEQATPFIDTGLLGAMVKAVEQWHTDTTDENALLVTGEKGSGKSMAMQKLVKKLEKEQPDLRLVTVSVPPRTLTPEAVTTMIGEALGETLEEGPASLVKGDEQRPPTLLVLDEAQNCFLARIGGLNGWQALLTLTNARLDNLFWLVMINNQSWAYLSNVFGGDYQFRRVIKVKRWDQSEIRSLILSRHHLSDKRLRYDDLLLSSRGPEAGNIRNAEQRYFSLLWDACGGNPMVALKLWLTSIKVSPREVLVGLPAQPASSLAAGQAGDSLLFVYAAIVTHENLSSDEIVAVTDLPENIVRSALKAGQDAGFIYKAEDGRYRLVPVWYRTVINQLNRKNLLHE